MKQYVLLLLFSTLQVAALAQPWQGPFRRQPEKSRTESVSFISFCLVARQRQPIYPPHPGAVVQATGPSRWIRQTGRENWFLAFRGVVPSIKPNLSLRFQTNKTHAWSIGYGLQRRVYPLGSYYQAPEVVTNQNLVMPLWRAHRMGLSGSWVVHPCINVHVEVYYQRLHLWPLTMGDVRDFFWP